MPSPQEHLFGKARMKAKSMNSKPKIWRIIIVTVGVMITILIVLIASILLFDPFHEVVRAYPGGDLSDFSDKDIHFFTINPGTILSSLNADTADVFIPEIATPQSPAIQASVVWHQTDYQKIADALFERVWNEPSDNWNLYFMRFETSCGESLSGFESADFYYFEPHTIYNEKVYAGREIIIDPEYTDVSVGDGTGFPQPRFFGWKSINLNTVKISADQALFIADQNGGQKFRSAKTKCNILVRLYPDVDGTVWHIFYYGSTTFEIHVDAINGNISYSN